MRADKNDGGEVTERRAATRVFVFFFNEEVSTLFLHTGTAEQPGADGFSFQVHFTFSGRGVCGGPHFATQTPREPCARQSPLTAAQRRLSSSGRSPTDSAQLALLIVLFCSLDRKRKKKNRNR